MSYYERKFWKDRVIPQLIGGAVILAIGGIIYFSCAYLIFEERNYQNQTTSHRLSLPFLYQ